MSERSTSLSEFTGLGGRATARSMGTPVPGGAQTISTSSTAAFSTVIPEGSFVAILSTAVLFVRMTTTALSDPAVAGADFAIPANTLVFLQMGRDTSNVPYKYISVVNAAAVTGTCYISRIEGNQY